MKNEWVPVTGYRNFGEAGHAITDYIVGYYSNRRPLQRANLWRVDKPGDYPNIIFEEACVRWPEEKSDKKSTDTDKSIIGFWLDHYSGVLIKNIDA